jgi:pimeloyl-ACP methyl ester carboxylesterase
MLYARDNMIPIRLAALVAIACGATAQNTNLGADAAGFERGYVAVAEGRISYLHRPGSGPTVVLIPGSFSDAHQWDSMLASLPASWRLVLVELRGHGHSWPPPGNGSIEQFGEDVVAIADKLGIERFYAGGHSIGGMVALELGRAFPARIRGIMSLEGWTHYQAIADAFGNAVRPTLTAEQEARRLAERKRATGGWTDEQRRAFAQIYKRWDGATFLRTTALPVLEIYGDRGNPRPPLAALRIPERPNIQVYWLAGASHNVTIERPGEVAEAMVRFVTAVESVRPPGRAGDHLRR